MSIGKEIINGLNQSIARERIKSTIDNAITKYPLDRLSFVHNEETGMFDLMYSTEDNSFAASTNVLEFSEELLNEYIECFDEFNISYEV
jgi:hypothetical protein